MLKSEKRTEIFRFKEEQMEQLLLSRERAAEALNISVDTLDRLANAGQIKRLKIGTRTCFHADEVSRFAYRLAQVGSVAIRR